MFSTVLKCFDSDEKRHLFEALKIIVSVSFFSSSDPSLKCLVYKRCLTYWYYDRFVGDTIYFVYMVLFFVSVCTFSVTISTCFLLQVDLSSL